MQIIEFYTGDDGRSHTRDYTPQEFASEAEVRLSGPFAVAVPNTPRARPGGFAVDWHPYGNSATLSVMCTGISEYETADGWRRLYPGDIVIFNDPDCQGHKYRVHGVDDRIALSGDWDAGAAS